MSVKPNHRSSSALLLTAAAQAVGRGGSATSTTTPNLIAGIAGFVLGYFRRRESLHPTNQSGGAVPPGGFESVRRSRRPRRTRAASRNSTGGSHHG